ncbi:MAG: FUSC family protein [Proteobacteria bacterium]|nr:FUSC family protein [Pseudomonadota bacterium]
MSSIASDSAWRRFARNADLHFGLQLAFAVVAAYAASALLRLPENLWAVMSALIVVRPSAGSTMGAGWDRVRGALAGTAIGLGGVALRHVGAPPASTAVTLVALLALGSALLPALRSAPMTALIVLGSGGIGGHSPLQVAGLRVAEIVVGVVVGLGVSLLLPSARATRRFDAACAATLRRLARELEAGFDLHAGQADAKEARAAAGREKLRQLAILAIGADRERRWFDHRARRGDAGAGRAEPHRQLARLLGRIAQDAALPARLYEALPRHRADVLWPGVRSAAGSALDAAARAFQGGAEPDLGDLRTVAAGRMASDGAPAAPEVRAALAGPLQLLAHDLALLARLRRREAAAG